MNDSSLNVKIAEIKDIEVFLALKQMCRYLIDEAWSTTSDPEYEFAISKTKEHEQDIRMLAEIDKEVAYGQMKYKNKDGLWINKDAGDLNQWYEGELTLSDFLNSVEHLVELIESTTHPYMPEAEFVHYYNYLKYVRDRLPKIILDRDNADTQFENLHQKIQNHCEDRFYNQQYSDAILAAYKVVLNEIKNITNIHDLDGKALIEKAFSLSNPLIKLNDLSTQSDRDEQLGFMMLFSGAAVGIRNPKAHDLVIQEDKSKTLRYLSFASLLLERLDERKYPEVNAA